MGALEVLHHFHDRHAGASHVVFGHADTGDGRTSYDQLFELVPKDAKRVLDLACGDGPLLERLKTLPSAKLAAAERRLQGSVRLLQGTAQVLPFDAAAFDVVTSHMALMLMDEQDVVIRELRRVLRPGGMLAFVVGRTDSVSPVEVPIWRWLHERWKLEALKMGFAGRAWSTAAGIEGLLSDGFSDIATAPIVAKVVVPIGELARFLELAYYPVDALSDAGKQALAEYIAVHAKALAPDGTITWTFEMIVGSALRRP